MLFQLNYFFILDYKLYCTYIQDSIHHGYLKTGTVTIKKFNMNIVKIVLNSILQRQQFGLPITLPVTLSKNLITAENKKF